MKLLLLALGAILGAFSRYWVGTLIDKPSFPYATLFVNVAGCLFIGFFATLVTERLVVDPNIKAAVQIGFLGSFTTFSSFGFETIKLMTAGRFGLAFINIAVNNLLGLGAVWCGTVLGR